MTLRLNYIKNAGRKLLLKINYHQPKRLSHNLLSVSEDNGVRRIHLNDTRTRNSLSLAMVDALLASVNKDISNPSLRCIVLTAEGKVFSAGHNLKELVTEEGREVFSKFSALMMSLVQHPVPVVAAVDGLVAAAGTQLVAQCDLAICTQKSTFSTPGANVGVFCSTPGVAVARAVPRKIAAYMLLTGLPLTSSEALQHGLVHRVTPDADQLEHEIKTVTDAIIAKSRAVIELGKKMFYQQLNLDLPKAYELTGAAMIQSIELPDGKEGLRSFIEKRKPQWNHKNS